MATTMAVILVTIFLQGGLTEVSCSRYSHPITSMKVAQALVKILKIKTNVDTNNFIRQVRKGRRLHAANYSYLKAQYVDRQIDEAEGQLTARWGTRRPVHWFQSFERRFVYPLVLRERQGRGGRVGGTGLDGGESGPPRSPFSEISQSSFRDHDDGTDSDEGDEAVDRGGGDGGGDWDVVQTRTAAKCDESKANATAGRNVCRRKNHQQVHATADHLKIGGTSNTPDTKLLAMEEIENPLHSNLHEGAGLSASTLPSISLVGEISRQGGDVKRCVGTATTQHSNFAWWARLWTKSTVSHQQEEEQQKQHLVIAPPSDVEAPSPSPPSSHQREMGFSVDCASSTESSPLLNPQGGYTRHISIASTTVSRPVSKHGKEKPSGVQEFAHTGSIIPPQDARDLTAASPLLLLPPESDPHDVSLPDWRVLNN